MLLPCKYVLLISTVFKIQSLYDVTVKANLTASLEQVGESFRRSEVFSSKPWDTGRAFTPGMQSLTFSVTTQRTDITSCPTFLLEILYPN